MSRALSGFGVVVVYGKNDIVDQKVKTVKK
jgi:hypothetical protein